MCGVLPAFPRNASYVKESLGHHAVLPITQNHDDELGERVEVVVACRVLEVCDIRSVSSEGVDSGEALCPLSRVTGDQQLVIGEAVKMIVIVGSKELSVVTGATATEGLDVIDVQRAEDVVCLLYTSPSPRDLSTSRMPSSA